MFDRFGEVMLRSIDLVLASRTSGGVLDFGKNTWRCVGRISYDRQTHPDDLNRDGSTY